jgi:hypothetical protein
MLEHKIALLALILGLLVAPAAADLEFRDPDNVSFYTGLEFNGDNQIYGLAEPTASSSPVRLQDIESGYYNLSGDTLEGDLNVDGNNINNFFDSACGEDQAVKDVYNNGTFVCGESGGVSGLSEVLQTNSTANQSIQIDGGRLVTKIDQGYGANQFYSYGDATWMEPGIQFRKAEGSQSNPSNVTDGQELGQFTWQGYGGGFQTGALLRAEAVEGFDSDSYGTQVELFTVEEGTTDLKRKLLVDSRGNLEIPEGSINVSGNADIEDNLELGGSLTLENGQINLLGNSLTGLPVSDDSNDAVRQDQLSGYYKLNGDTLQGDMDLNGYELKDSSGPVTLGGSDVEIPDGNINLNGNNLTSTGNQEMCAGDMC